MGILVLAGGGEFRSSMELVDHAMLARAKRTPCRVGILPTAVAPYRPDLAIMNAVRHFTALGAESHPIMALTRGDAENPVFATQLEDLDVVYIAGGDPWYLQNTLEYTPVWDALVRHYENGGIVAGSSAGAMILGAVMWQRDGALWKHSLGLAGNIGILAHLEEAGNARVESLWNALPAGITMIGLDSSTGIIVDTDARQADIVGQGGVVILNAEGVRYEAPSVIRWAY